MGWDDAVEWLQSNASPDESIICFDRPDLADVDLVVGPEAICFGWAIFTSGVAEGSFAKGFDLRGATRMMGAPLPFFVPVPEGSLLAGGTGACSVSSVAFGENKTGATVTDLAVDRATL